VKSTIDEEPFAHFNFSISIRVRFFAEDKTVVSIASLMIKNTPSSFEYREIQRDTGTRGETFSMSDYCIGHGCVNSSPKEKGLPLLLPDPVVSDILPGIVAQVKREVGSPFLYYSR